MPGLLCDSSVFQSTPPRRGRRRELSLTIDASRVSIHAPAKGATAGSTPVDNTALFQSTPPRRGRPTGRSGIDVRVFQSTPPRRGRRLPAPRIRLSSMFQSTPPRRGRRLASADRALLSSFQSTPPRRGRPMAGCIADRNVSIHAPAKGATGCCQMIVWDVSIHAPAKGATGVAGDIPSTQCFNPRPREGGDGRPVQDIPTISMFQSTPPRRGRPRASAPASCQFQSTPPRRGRQRRPAGTRQ